MEVHEWEKLSERLRELQSDCFSCCGLCCTALTYAKTEGFPGDKEAGMPCLYLDTDFHCAIHGELAARKLRGCMAYDCLGAGQRVTEGYGSVNWRSNPAISQQMFASFQAVYELNQIRWYLEEASAISCAQSLWGEVCALLRENESITKGCPEEIAEEAIDAHRQQVNVVLKKVASLVQQSVIGRKEKKHKRMYLGKDLRKEDLRGKDFSMALLIGANLSGCCLSGTNLLGADMRDTILEDADISQGLFLTQRQINAAKGSRGTRLPPTLAYPSSWPV